MKLNVFTDASGALGFGAVFGSHWFFFSIFFIILFSHWCYGKWPPGWEHKNIALLEFHTIVLSLDLWGVAMCTQCIIFFYGQ